MNKYFNLIALLLFFNFLSIPVSAAETEIRSIFFPTEKETSFTDSFGAGRYSRTHEGTDIMGKQMMPLYAAVDGTVTGLIDPEALWGYALTLTDAEGYSYHYLHINNDSPGTDDGQGGADNAYAPGIKKGVKVSKGQLVAWMGDSGNAEAVGHHLHFEIRRPDDTPINAYSSLKAALSALPVLSYDPALARESSLDINMDKALAAGAESACSSGTLVKLSGAQSVYYCGADGKRYVFPNEKIYFSWYQDFAQVTEISAEKMASLPLGGNVTYRPGIRMIKIQTDPRVYAVAKGGVLRWIRSTESAAQLYGADWKQKIDDLPDAFFMDYASGKEI